MCHPRPTPESPIYSYRTDSHGAAGCQARHYLHSRPPILAHRTAMHNTWRRLNVSRCPVADIRPVAPRPGNRLVASIAHLDDAQHMQQIAARVQPLANPCRTQPMRRWLVPSHLSFGHAVKCIACPKPRHSYRCSAPSVSIGALLEPFLFWRRAV